MRGTFPTMASTDATPTLVAELGRATAAQPYDRKVLLSGRPAEGRELLRALALSGRAWIGWEPWSLRQLAHAVIALDVAREGLRTADPFDVMALVDRAIDQVESTGGGGLFNGTVPGVYRDPIRRTVETLREAGVRGPALRAMAGPDPKLRLIGDVLAAYESALAAEKLLDGAALLGRAADNLTGGAGRAALPTEHVYLLPGLSLRGLEGRLVRALLDLGATVLSTDPAGGLDAPAGRLWATSPGVTGPLSRLHDQAADAGNAGRLEPPPIDLFAAATPADELREVIRRALRAGIPWDQVEIVATDTTTYGTALDGLARRLDIPVTYSDGLPLGRTRVGRAVDAYFRWIGEDFPVDAIRFLLENNDLAPTPTPAGAGSTAPPTPSSPALARRLRRLRIGWGYGRYLPALDRALAAVERDAQRRHGDGDEETAAATRDRERAELLALRGLLKPILDATPRPAGRRAAWGDRTSPSRLAGGLLAMLAHVPAGDAVENTARTVLVERLERARASLTRETGWMAATGILRSRLATRIAATSGAGRTSPWTSTGGHLHLSGIAMGGLAARPHTFVVGLSAGAVSAGATDPLLTDMDRGRANQMVHPPGHTPALPTTAERIEASRHALAAMLGRLRGHITLSYAAWDMTEGRTIGPAPELLQALRLRDRDGSLTYEDLRQRLGRLACAVPTPSHGAVDASDVWLAALATPDGRLRDGRAAVRAVHRGLDRGLTATEIRDGDRLTAYHGAVPADPGLDPLTGGAVLSASRLETLGKCPLRYFYRYVLGVRPVRDPEYDPERWLDALERGSLLHAAYERALGERPAGMDYADDGFLAHALAVTREEVARTQLRLPAPNDAVLRSERDGLEADVRSFVAMIRDARPRVVRTELAFGPDADSEGLVELPVGGGLLRLRGRVDRLDATEGGGLRVVDYKTGSARGHHPATPFDGGRRLQHLLYSLAVERLRPEESVEAAEYHFPTTRGENRRFAYDRAALEPGRRIVAALLGMARAGRFVATNDPDDCTFCDFADVCRVTKNDFGGVASPRATWAKANAPGLPEYAPLVSIRSDRDSDG